MTKTDLPAVLITGASAGIGTAYAERFARRGHDLILVARDQAKLQALAARLGQAHGVRVDVLPADLSEAKPLAAVEERLRADRRIGILVNNAGVASPGGFAESDPQVDERMIRLNILALTRLTEAVIPRFLESGEGAIVNLASTLAIATEVLPGAYPATKSFVLAFSQSLQAELGPRGIYVQVVLPSATKTEIWERSGLDPARIPVMMETNVLVDAALVGFDRRELVTIPTLHDLGQWETFQAARKAMIPNFRQEKAAARYQA